MACASTEFSVMQMQEFGPKFDSEVLQNKKRLEACDVLLFLYDSGDVNSFAYVANLRVRSGLAARALSLIF